MNKFFNSSLLFLVTAMAPDAAKNALVRMAPRNLEFACQQGRTRQSL